MTSSASTGRRFARPLGSLLTRSGAIAFDHRTGTLRVGDAVLGTVPPGTREYHLLACLADHPGETVPYADLKRHVCAVSGSRDETDEATFCQELKRRIKRAHGVQAIDRVIRTDRRGGGYIDAHPDV